MNTIEVEVMMFSCVRAYYERDWQTAKAMRDFIHDNSDFRPKWWNRFMVDFSAWLQEIGR